MLSDEVLEFCENQECEEEAQYYTDGGDYVCGNCWAEDNDN